MISTQILTDGLMTVAFLVGVAVAFALWVMAVSKLQQRDDRRAHIHAIERHLADAAAQRQVTTR
jgi:hypothetical protein